MMIPMTLKTFSLLSLALLLTACAGGSAGSYNSNNSYGSSVHDLPETKSINKETEASLSAAAKAGNKQEAIAILKKVYTNNSDDPIVAVRYARALREDDQINAAARILTPFTKGKKTNGLALTEMAMTQLALGKFKSAEKYAQGAVDIDDKNARAYLALGTAQDAQKEHQKAEIAFREGIKHWKGDPTPIMNNLALNLASQGHLEEALSLIEKAQKRSPGRMDLERNRRIIATLLETTGPRAPTPAKKPQ